MPAGHGLRCRTRDSFSRAFRGRGYIPLSTYLRNYKIGDYVDIKVNSAVLKGMPHKVYHGRTGVVWNVTKRALGVEVNKQLDVGDDCPSTAACQEEAPHFLFITKVNTRIVKKRIHVRVEHVAPSRCKEEFLTRRARNDAAKAEAKKAGKPPPKVKREPKGPREGFTLENVKLETCTAIPYDIVKEGLQT